MKTEASSRFDQQVMCHLDLVYRMALKLSRDSNEAEDLVQETFLKAHRAFDQFELREYGAKPWLLKILHNLYFSRGMRSARAPTLLEDLSLDDFAAELESEPLTAAGGLNWDNVDQELKAGIDALSPEYRSVLMLWALGDLSYQEIAEVMDCAIGTVMSRLYRARQQLSQYLAEYAADKGIRRKRP